MASVPNPIKKPGRKRRVRSARERILKTAADLIVDRGYSGCTMRAIAKAVGMKAASLYYHFRSKEEIVEEILTSSFAKHLEVLNGALAGLPKDASFSDRIDAAIRAHLSNIFESDIPYVLVYQHLPPRLKLKNMSSSKNYAEVWTRLFRSGVRGGDIVDGLNIPVVVHLLVVGMLDTAPEWFHIERITADELVQIVKRILFNGIAAKPA